MVCSVQGRVLTDGATTGSLLNIGRRVGSFFGITANAEPDDTTVRVVTGYGDESSRQVQRVSVGALADLK